MAQQNQNAQDTPLWEEDELEKDKWSSALLGFVNEPGAAGRTRKGAIALLAEMLHAVNALEVAWEPTTLFEDITSSAPEDSDLSETFNLDFKSGNSGPRHNFTDGYTFFELYLGEGSIPDSDLDLGSVEVIAPRLLNSSPSTPAVIALGLTRFSGSSYTKQNFVFAKASDTSFRIGTRTSNYVSSSGDNIFILARIVGWKMTIRPSSL